MAKNLQVTAPEIQVMPSINADDLYEAIKNPQAANTSGSYGGSLQNAPISPDSLYDAMHTQDATQNPQENMGWLDVAAQARQNLIPSGINMAKGLYGAVRHPIDTSKSILELAGGGLYNVAPDDIAKWIDTHADPEAVKAAAEKANAVGKFYKERYGSSEGFKKALAHDPVGVIGDISAILSGGETIAAKIPGLEATANVIGKAAEATNPITAPFRAVSAVGKPALGMLTGTSEEAIKAAAKNGYAKDPMFIEQIKGEGSKTEPLDNARFNLNVMKKNKSDEYRSGMIDISKDKSVLDFGDIDKKLNDVKNSISFKGVTKNDSAMQTFTELEDEISKWKKLDSSEYHTPEGLDALKQRINGVMEKIPHTDAQSVRVGSEIYNTIKSTIKEQAPTYSKVMQDYSEASDQINEIERSLSLGNRASADTALKKLQSITRNNVSSSYGNRLNLAEQLEKEGEKPFISGLYGQALNSSTARGLAGNVEALTTLAGFLNPAAWAAIPFQTPSLVGKTLYHGGKAARGITDITSFAGKRTKGLLDINPTRINTLSSVLNAINTTKDEE